MNVRRFSALLALLLSSVGALAQTEEPAPPVYEIELIVFEYVNGVRGSREDWAYIDTGRQQAAAEMALNSDAAPEQNTEDTPAPDQKPVQATFTPVDPQSYRLSDQYQRLRNSRDYRPIAHTAWRQPVFDEARQTTFRLASLGRTPQSLGGEVSLFVTRFLHLGLDLKLAKNRTMDASGANTTIYTLRERRKMRSAELHFFDHPRFGALALISRTDNDTE